MKYEFKKNGEDDYSLIYKDQIINFKSDVKAVEQMQSAEANGRIKMIEDLSKRGISIKSLIIEKKENGKTYYDNTNKVELEKTYINEEFARTYLEIIERILGKPLDKLYNEMELTNDELKQFSQDLGLIITGKYEFPSGEVLSKEE